MINIGRMKAFTSWYAPHAELIFQYPKVKKNLAQFLITETLLLFGRKLLSKLIQNLCRGSFYKATILFQTM